MTETKGFVMLSRSEKLSSLPLTARVLLSEITALSTKNGICFATNAYFAEQYGLSERTITKYIQMLKDKDLIEIGRSPSIFGRIRVIRPKRSKEAELTSATPTGGGRATAQTVRSNFKTKENAS